MRSTRRIFGAHPALALAAAAAATAPAAAIGIVNGDFDDATSAPWLGGSCSLQAPPRITADGLSDLFFLRLGGNFPVDACESQAVWQHGPEFCVDEGFLTFELDVRTNDTSRPRGIEVTVSGTDASGQSYSESRSVNAPNTADVWQRCHRISLPVEHEGTATIRFLMSSRTGGCDDDPTSFLDIDNVRCVFTAQDLTTLTAAYDPCFCLCNVSEVEFQGQGSGEHVPPRDCALPTECDADLNGDGIVGFADIIEILSGWGPCSGCCPADIDGDGLVGFSDIIHVLSDWGEC